MSLNFWFGPPSRHGEHGLAWSWTIVHPLKRLFLLYFTVDWLKFGVESPNGELYKELLIKYIKNI